jgi:Hg(II)-responsive transcriptional regulator
MKTMTIGQLAKQAGINNETVRYYEQRGLIPKPVKNASGYRQYSARDLARLKFIRRSQALGFTLREIGDLLSLQRSAETTCKQVRHIADAKIADIEQRIGELGRMKDALARLADTCTSSTVGNECPILDALDDTDETKNE